MSGFKAVRLCFIILPGCEPMQILFNMETFQLVDIMPSEHTLYFVKSESLTFKLINVVILRGEKDLQRKYSQRANVVSMTILATQFHNDWPTLMLVSSEA
jgi:hypothetical protein